MASPISFYLLLLALLLQTHLSLSTAYPTNGRRSVPEVHDLLPSYKLPKGIIPDNVKSYTLSSTGEFTIELESSCYVHFDELVYYEKTIRGRLSYGAVHDVSGIQAKMFFLWLPVTGIQADGISDMVKFFVGALSKTVPLYEFRDIPFCMADPYASI